MLDIHETPYGNVNATKEFPFTVDYRGSHPDEDADDCWTGESFATEAEARAFFAMPVLKRFSHYTEYLVLQGPGGLCELKKNPEFRAPEKAPQVTRCYYCGATRSHVC